MLAFDWIYPLAAAVIVIVVATVVRACMPFKVDVTVHHDKEKPDEHSPDRDR